MFGTETVHQFEILVTLIVGTRLELVLQPLHLLFESDNGDKRFASLFAHRSIVLYLHHLRQISHLRVTADRNRSLGRWLLPAEDFEHR